MWNIGGLYIAKHICSDFIIAVNRNRAASSEHCIFSAVAKEMQNDIALGSQDDMLKNLKMPVEM